MQLIEQIEEEKKEKPKRKIIVEDKPEIIEKKEEKPEIIEEPKKEEEPKKVEELHEYIGTLARRKEMLKIPQDFVNALHEISKENKEYAQSICLGVGSKKFNEFVNVIKPTKNNELIENIRKSLKHVYNYISNINQINRDLFFRLFIQSNTFMNKCINLNNKSYFLKEDEKLGNFNVLYLLQTNFLFLCKFSGYKNTIKYFIEQDIHKYKNIEFRFSDKSDDRSTFKLSKNSNLCVLTFKNPKFLVEDIGIYGIIREKMILDNIKNVIASAIKADLFKFEYVDFITNRIIINYETTFELTGVKDHCAFVINKMYLYDTEKREIFNDLTTITDVKESNSFSVSDLNCTPLFVYENYFEYLRCLNKITYMKDDIDDMTRSLVFEKFFLYFQYKKNGGKISFEDFMDTYITPKIGKEHIKRFVKRHGIK